MAVDREIAAKERELQTVQRQLAEVAAREAELTKDLEAKNRRQQVGALCAAAVLRRCLGVFGAGRGGPFRCCVRFGGGRALFKGDVWGCSAGCQAGSFTTSLAFSAELAQAGVAMTQDRS